MDKDIDYYLSAFEKMKRAIMRGVKAPHKPLLLLAILNLCQRGTIKDNHIVLSSELVGEFRKFFSSLKSLRDVFAYAEIDQELFDLMVNRDSAVILECKLRELV